MLIVWVLWFGFCVVRWFSFSFSFFCELVFVGCCRGCWFVVLLQAMWKSGKKEAAAGKGPFVLLLFVSMIFLFKLYPLSSLTPVVIHGCPVFYF
ncbi:hypothetical protein B0T22DRAFT_447362 [Podospora appendiculata]|uniref:Uncharacterized protein n=1 Tax=Podospora appendiculata TaxID=314037 RepID=A0AAE0XFK9_9PEZI|nr:hypothetical protein B0T22DRAFT_447362 [Podospora appendiculata]